MSDLSTAQNHFFFLHLGIYIYILLKNIQLVLMDQQSYGPIMSDHCLSFSHLAAENLFLRSNFTYLE